MAKLWVDDIRRAPDESWLWARTNEEARLHFLNSEIEEVSLDHDMGLHLEDPDEQDADLRIGVDEADGVQLVRWMVEHDKLPDKITIHSWNPRGAQSMNAELMAAGRFPTVMPCDRG